MGMNSPYGANKKRAGQNLLFNCVFYFDSTVQVDTQ